jgi:hypothetical protein
MSSILTRLLGALGIGGSQLVAAQPTFEQQLAVFQQHGFTLNDGVTTADLLRWDEGAKAFTTAPFSLLYITLGMTTEEEPWTPLTDRCWHFDTEAIEDEDSYVRIVHDMARITRGALVCTEVKSGLDYEQGKAWVSFVANGQPVRWDLKVDNDWVDPGFFSRMAALTTELGLKGRYTYFDTGGQDLVVGFETPEDLARLKAATGLAIIWLE